MKRILLFLFFLPFLSWAAKPELSRVITPRGEINPLSENKQIVQKFYEAFAKNNSRELDALLASNYKVQDSTVVFDSDYSKYDAFSKNMKVRLKTLHDALPDFKLDILEMLGEGNKVLARVQISGVQRGPFLGVEATNKPIVIRLFVLFTIDGGKISHINEVWNEFGVMKQIGYIIW